MYRGVPIFSRMQAYGPRQTKHGVSGIGWLTMVPGLGVIGVALAMIIWPPSRRGGPHHLRAPASPATWMSAPWLACTAQAHVALPWRVASPLQRPGEPGGAEQYPLHLVHIRTRAFDLRGQTVPVQEQRLRLAAVALSPAAHGRRQPYPGRPTQVGASRLTCVLPPRTLINSVIPQEAS
jgi:hypothetical protein